MNRNKKAKVLAAAGAAVSAFFLGAGAAEAAPVAGASALIPTVDDPAGAISETGRVAGANAAVADMLLAADSEAGVAGVATTDEEAPAEAEENKESEYANVAIVSVEDSANVRAGAGEEFEIIGKVYGNNYATVEDVEGDWYKITSGNVSGYVHKDFLKVDDKEAIDAAGELVATVDADTLYVRTETSTDAEVMTLTGNGEEMTALETTKAEDGSEWVRVSVNGGEGYVSADFVSVDTVYSYGETNEEIEARLEAERLLNEDAEHNGSTIAQRNAAAAANTRTGNGNATSTAATSYSNSYYTPSASGNAVVDYASNFLGNPYVYGGSSLTNGTDCSGFVMSVYANFGVSLPHSSSADRYVGSAVSTSDMQAGDIVCYSGHVGIYAGNGKIINAATESTGIVYTNVNYAPIVAVRRVM